MGFGDGAWLYMVKTVSDVICAMYCYFHLQVYVVASPFEAVQRCVPFLFLL